VGASPGTVSREQTQSIARDTALRNPMRPGEGLFSENVGDKRRGQRVPIQRILEKKSSEEFVHSWGNQPQQAEIRGTVKRKRKLSFLCLSSRNPTPRSEIRGGIAVVPVVAALQEGDGKKGSEKRGGRNVRLDLQNEEDAREITHWVGGWESGWTGVTREGVHLIG